jgi:hypothetical protein
MIVTIINLTNQENNGVKKMKTLNISKKVISAVEAHEIIQGGGMNFILFMDQDFSTDDFRDYMGVDQDVEIDIQQVKAVDDLVSGGISEDQAVVVDGEIMDTED